MPASVLALWRYPVKSCAGEAVRRLELGPAGAVGDRAWAVVEHDGTLVSAKHPQRGGALLQVRASTREDGSVTVQVPGGMPVAAGTPPADDALSDLLGRPVRLTREVRPDAVLWRRWPAGLVPDWHAARAGEEARTRVAGAAHGRFADFGAVHVLGSADLERLEQRTGGDVGALRFRPNVVVEGEVEVGDVLTAGSLALRVVLPTPRCVVPSLGAVGVRPHAGVLPELARHFRMQVGDRGRAACLGHYADVVRPGELAVGQHVRTGSAEPPPGQAVSSG